MWSPEVPTKQILELRLGVRLSDDAFTACPELLNPVFNMTGSQLLIRDIHGLGAIARDL